ncbi:MAG: S-adenosylmethionine:tRNA ribosyltransferase-isomerase, partial [Thermodesulfobacteriota bacterium]
TKVFFGDGGGGGEGGEGGELEAVAVEADPEGMWRFELSADGRGGGAVREVIEKLGRVPLPPYIRREAEPVDKLRYQTVFAGKEGAVAAPTAGLHFTDRVIEEIKGMGVEPHYITLHTGPATFMPVRVDNMEEHRMPGESYSIGPDVFSAIRRAKEEGRRVVAVGSTVTRALEASVIDGIESPGGIESPRLDGDTALFISPGFEFKVVDALVTNFHLPCSTLIMLVSALAGGQRIMAAYKEAVKEGYRFFSYGDCMMIV